MADIDHECEHLARQEVSFKAQATRAEAAHQAETARLQAAEAEAKGLKVMRHRSNNCEAGISGALLTKSDVWAVSITSLPETLAHLSNSMHSLYIASISFLLS